MAGGSATRAGATPIEAEHPAVLESSLLRDAGFRHGFFTRRGGVSSSPFASLSFTRTTGDLGENVDENIRRAARFLAVPAEQLYFPLQVHGIANVVVDGSEDRMSIEGIESDITITREPVAAAIRTADCVPILVACRRTGWVAACHAGWKGCVRGVVPETISRLRERGACELLASIGPHISVRAFEVSGETAEELIAASPDPEILVNQGDRKFIDLRKMVHAQLRESGLGSGCVDDVFGCTVFDERDFYSFRRDGDRSGRMLSAIVGGLDRSIPACG